MSDLWTIFTTGLLFAAFSHPKRTGSFTGKPNIEQLKYSQDVDGLIGALDYERDVDTRWQAAEALRMIGLPAIEPLHTVAANARERALRKMALITLGLLGDARVIEDLHSILTGLKPSSEPGSGGVKVFDDEDLGHVPLDLERLLVMLLARMNDPWVIPYLRRHPEWGTHSLIPQLEEIERQRQRKHIRENMIPPAEKGDLQAVANLVFEGDLAVLEVVRAIDERQEKLRLARAEAAANPAGPSAFWVEEEVRRSVFWLNNALNQFGRSARGPLQAVLSDPKASQGMKSIAQARLKELGISA